MRDQFADVLLEWICERTCPEARARCDKMSDAREFDPLAFAEDDEEVGAHSAAQLWGSAQHYRTQLLRNTFVAQLGASSCSTGAEMFGLCERRKNSLCILSCCRAVLIPRLVARLVLLRWHPGLNERSSVC